MTDKKNEYRWLNDISQQFLERDYLLEGQTVDERVDIICNNAEKILGKKGFAKKFKENFKKGWYSFSTPIWTNFGNDRGMPISCFGSSIQDNMESIASTWAEVCMMTKHGGGTSAYFGNLRSRGSKINQNGESSGSVNFMQAFDNLINVVSQGKTRRGNFAAYLPIDHEDIIEFLQIRSEGASIQDLSFGVCVPDAWMEDMIAGNAAKRKVWAKVIETRTNLGYPYIFFTDTVNRNTVDCYKDKDMKISHSNLCVTGDQRVVTNKGMKTVYELYENQENLVLFDGEKSVEAEPMKLIEKKAATFKVTTEGGREHKITDYHKLKTPNGMVALKDLKIGDQICVQRNKGLFGDKHNPELAFLLGLYQGDGTQTEKQIFIDLWENDFDLCEEIEECLNKIYIENNWNEYYIDIPNRGNFKRKRETPKFSNCNASEGGVLKKRVGSTPLKKFGFEKQIVPEWIWQSNEETQWAYIKGLYITDGTVTLNSSHGSPISLSFTNTSKEYLKSIQILMDNLGIKTSIYKLNEEGNRLLPDGKGGRKEFFCKSTWRLICGNKSDCLKFNEKTNFLERKGIKLENRDYRDNTKKFDKIKSIEFNGWEDVYCTTVKSEEHVWVCNSFITSNCTEIFLPDSEEESFVCDLSSMNILYYEEWKDTDAVELLTYFLDAVMTEFIEKTKGIKFMERAVKFAERHRALGIGWLGWHSYLQSKMIPFESMEAKLLTGEIAEYIKKEAYAASAKLALEYGEPEVCKGYGRRNSTLLAIAPTKSSAFIIGQVSEGIEPDRTNYYIKDLQKGKFTIKNKYLEKLLQEKGKDVDEVWESILLNGGSIQHLNFLTENEKAVFKTFGEISQKEIIIQASIRQKHIDQGQSINLMIHPSTSTKEINALLIEAWKLEIKSLYYQISMNAAQNFSRNLLACTNCEA